MIACAARENPPFSARLTRECQNGKKHVKHFLKRSYLVAALSLVA
jgi:hypothetical protein